MPCPVPANGGQLYSVSATSPTDMWAVGWTGGDATTDGQQTLIEHWNGTAWTRVPSPNPADAGNFLHGVAATSPADAWAVGQANYTGHEDPLILHGTARPGSRSPATANPPTPN